MGRAYASALREERLAARQKPLVTDSPSIEVRSEWLRPELVGTWRFIACVVVVMFGPAIIPAAIYGLHHASGDFLSMFRDRTLILNGAFEAAMLGLFLIVLHGCGWCPADLRIRMGWRSTVEGIGLLFATYLGLMAVMIFLLMLLELIGHASWVNGLVPKFAATGPGVIQLTWPVIIVFTFVNAFYEELVYMGFTFNQVAAKLGSGWALAATVMIRLSIHTYQGTSHAVQIGTWALIFGIAYRWRKCVWPLILAHACIDLFSLGALKILFS